jgi:hypothetical protein
MAHPTVDPRATTPRDANPQAVEASRRCRSPLSYSVIRSPTGCRKPHQVLKVGYLFLYDGADIDSWIERSCTEPIEPSSMPGRPKALHSLATDGIRGGRQLTAAISLGRGRCSLVAASVQEAFDLGVADVFFVLQGADVVADECVDAVSESACGLTER